MFYLTAMHRAALKAETGIESWHFEQHADEAVFIPAGCPHQARLRRLPLADLSRQLPSSVLLNPSSACLLCMHGGGMCP